MYQYHNRLILIISLSLTFFSPPCLGNKPPSFSFTAIDSTAESIHNYSLLLFRPIAHISANPALHTYRFIPPGSSPITLTPDTIPVHLTPSSSSFLVLADIHVNEDDSTTYRDGIYTDASSRLWKLSLAKIDSVLSGKAGTPKPRFVVVLGDLSVHSDTPRTHAWAIKNFPIVIKDLHWLGRHGTPIFYLPGNNDSPEDDYGPFSCSLFKGSGVPCSGLLNHPSNNARISDASKWNELGCYAAYPMGKQTGLKLIALNTNMFAVHHNEYEKAGHHRPSDIAAQMNWLGIQLQYAKVHGEKVILAMHVPPGKDGHGATPELWNYTTQHPECHFLDTLKKYQSSIVGLLTAHSHMDGVRLVEDEAGQPINIIVSAPAISTLHHNPPSIKLFSFQYPARPISTPTDQPVHHTSNLAAPLSSPTHQSSPAPSEKYTTSRFDWLDFTTLYYRDGKWNSYSFKNSFHCDEGKDNKDMKAWLYQLPKELLEKYNGDIYCAGVTLPGEHPDSTLFVHPPCPE